MTAIVVSCIMSKNLFFISPYTAVSIHSFQTSLLTIYKKLQSKKLSVGTRRTMS